MGACHGVLLVMEVWAPIVFVIQVFAVLRIVPFVVMLVFLILHFVFQLRVPFAFLLGFIDVLVFRAMSLVIIMFFASVRCRRWLLLRGLCSAACACMVRRAS